MPQQLVGPVLVQDVDAVPDPSGAGDLDGLADVDRRSSGGTNPIANSPAWRVTGTPGVSRASAPIIRMCRR